MPQRPEHGVEKRPYAPLFGHSPPLWRGQPITLPNIEACAAVERAIGGNTPEAFGGDGAVDAGAIAGNGDTRHIGLGPGVGNGVPTQLRVAPTVGAAGSHGQIDVGDNSLMQKNPGRV